MALSLLGSHFLHPDRNLYGKLSFSVELVYRSNAPAGFDFYAARDRVQQCFAKGAKVALRVDDANRQALPPEGDSARVSDYVSFCQRLAADPIFGRCDWLICGNEPNLAAENVELGRPAQPYWVPRVVYGHTCAPEDTGNVYQYVRTVNPTMQVLLPAIAPYSPEMGGGQQMPDIIDQRSAWAPWESYWFDVALGAYDNNWHADLGEIKAALHAYGAPGIAQYGPGEPFVDVRESTYSAQFGSRWLQDALALFVSAQARVYGSRWNPWVLVSEANVLRPPQNPATDYPSGWWQQFVRYVATLPNVMGCAGFVDQDYGGNWGETAMTSGLGRCPQWDHDHDTLLRNGW